MDLVHPDCKIAVKLVPERTYYRKVGRGDGLHSVSYSQVPDVAVEVHSPDERPRVYLFDPKYKLKGEHLEGESGDGSPKKVDIDKMHAYRDATRGEEGERLVHYAAILYPGPSVRYVKGLEALSAYPGTESALERRIGELLREALGHTPH